MGNFNKFDKGRDSGRGFGGGRKFGGHGGAPRQMFQAICSQCGQTAEVPFKPTGDRAVFCRNCFKSQGSQSAPSPRFAPKSFGGRDSRENFGAHSGGNANTGGAVSKAQFDSLNVKLDKILAMLAPSAPKPEAKIKNTPTASRGLPMDVGRKTKTLAKKSKAKKK